MKALKLEKCGLFDAKEIQKFAVYEDAMVELHLTSMVKCIKSSFEFVAGSIGCVIV